MRHWLLFGIVVIALFTFLARSRVSRRSAVPPPTTSPTTSSSTAPAPALPPATAAVTR